MWLIVLVAAVIPLGKCSWGDRSSDFRSCTRRCSSLTCEPTAEVKLEWHLRLLGWSCLEECQYQCMHEVTAEDVRHSRPVRQFFGKWPFVRVLGVQEPASVVFSVLNGLSAYVGYQRFCRRVPKTYPLYPLIKFQFVVTLNAWLWSTVFHSRDLNWTEKLDYFSASLFIVVGLVLQFVRISGPNAIRWQVVYGVVWAVLFACHVTYLSVFKFDYGYNMTASVLSGLLYSAIWVTWCIKNRQERLYVWKCVATVVATSCFVSLELLDFPPLWWTLDAHSLWHLSTVPLPLLWYSFLQEDATYEIKASMTKKV